MKLGPSDRSKATQALYQKAHDEGTLIGIENEPSIVDHWYWRLIVNRYPYDERWCTSMLLVLKRKCTWDELTDKEVLERHQLENHYLEAFDKVGRNGKNMSSVHHTPHVHLLQGKK